MFKFWIVLTFRRGRRLNFKVTVMGSTFIFVLVPDSKALPSTQTESTRL